MYYYCEITRGNLEHSVINALMLKAFNALAGSDAILFCNDAHSQGINSVDDLTYRERRSINVPNVKAGSKVSWIRKFFNDAVLLQFVLRSAKRENPEFVFFCSLSPVNTYLVNIFSKFFYKETKILIALHGELELLHKKDKKLVEKVFAFLLDRSLRDTANTIKYFVYGRHIVYRLKELGYKESLFVAIPHPYIFPSNQFSSSSSVLTVSHLGVAKLLKDSHLFFELARKMNRSVLDSKVSFKFIGPVLEEILPFSNDAVEFEAGEALISRNEYEALCSTSDVAVFFQTDRNYGFTSSGSLMDAIAYNMIIVSYDNSFVTSLRTSCPEGVYVFRNLNEITDFISELSKYPKKRIFDMRRSIDSLKPLFRIENVVSELKRHSYWQ